MQPRAQLYSLQYLRALAALLVVYSHAVQQHSSYAQWLPYYGDVGVDIFFVISGFILVWIANESDTPKTFLTRRISRVVPLYWFFTLVMAAIFVAMPSLVRGVALDLTALIKSLLFIPHWSASFPGELWPLLVPGWSLNYELFFYLVFAVSLWLPSRLRVVFTSLFIVTGFAVASLVPENTIFNSALQEFMSQSMLLEFIFGMLLAVWFQTVPTPKKGVGYLLVFSGVAVLVLHSVFYEPQLPRVLQFGVPALALVAGALIIAPGKKPLAVAMGDSSYSLYLSHGLVLGALRLVMPENANGGWQAAWGYLAVAMITSAIAGYLVHRIIDNWLLRIERVSIAGAKVGS